MILAKVQIIITNYSQLVYYNWLFVYYTGAEKYNSFYNYLMAMASYEALKASVEKNGEVMIRLDTGDKIELHKHNVTFDDSTKEIIVDAARETFWIGADRVSYYWIHKEGFEKE